jgi:3-phenylpropionate/trans-cinnamate dioxygenase ferredoxin subunit
VTHHPARGEAEPSFLDVCHVRDVPEGAVVAFRSNGRDLLLCNAGGEIFAVADRCTHAAWPLAGSELIGCEIVCALHGARFDLHTGEPTHAPASKPLQTFPVRLKNDRLEVRATAPPR